MDVVISTPRSDGNRASKWFTHNGMQAYPEKFQFMMISRNRSLTLNDITGIVSDDHAKMLGVVTDNKLNVSLHVSSFYKKASRQLNALARISNYLDVSAREQFMVTLWLAILIIVLLCGSSAEQQQQ